MTLAWSAEEIPDLTGRRALVTGVTSGIGRCTALELARHGAEVVLGARNPTKLDATMADLRREVPGARLVPLLVDLADLTSVRSAARQASALGPLHLLVNNAGVMATPYSRTADGFESQLATNHLGPFALTGLLLPRLVESGDGRVVALSSQGHRMARRAPLDDPRGTSGHYSAWQVYFQTKLADLLFMFELDRRLRAQGVPVKALAAHPGFAATGLMANDWGGKRISAVLQGAFGLLGQPPSAAALPTLMAATADLPGATYVGPGGPFEFRGRPTVVGATRSARDEATAARLWEISETATGVRYP